MRNNTSTLKVVPISSVGLVMTLLSFIDWQKLQKSYNEKKNEKKWEGLPYQKLFVPKIKLLHAWQETIAVLNHTSSCDPNVMKPIA